MMIHRPADGGRETIRGVGPRHVHVQVQLPDERGLGAHKGSIAEEVGVGEMASANFASR